MRDVEPTKEARSLAARVESSWYDGALPGGLAAPLGFAATLFEAGVSIRSALYDRGWLKSHRTASAQVISVGNLTVGGTGKTPAVIFLAQRALAASKRVAVLSRGYGRRTRKPRVFTGGAGLPTPEDVGDEPLLIARRCARVELHVGADRVASARVAEKHGAEVILLDDGFQHRRLARDLDILVIDEGVGFGNGRLLPLGPLREPLSALRRADLVWIRETVGRPAPLPRFAIPTIRVRDGLSKVVDPQGGEHLFEALRGRAVLALAGIARPERFPAALERAGLAVVGRALFTDHHLFTAPELEKVLREAERLHAIVVTTEKDAVRLPLDFPAWVAPLEVEIVEGEVLLAQMLGL